MPDILYKKFSFKNVRKRFGCSSSVDVQAVPCVPEAGGNGPIVMKRAMSTPLNGYNAEGDVFAGQSVPCAEDSVGQHPARRSTAAIHTPSERGVNGPPQLQLTYVSSSLDDPMPARPAPRRAVSTPVDAPIKNAHSSNHGTSVSTGDGTYTVAFPQPQRDEPMPFSTPSSSQESSASQPEGPDVPFHIPLPSIEEVVHFPSPAVGSSDLVTSNALAHPDQTVAVEEQLGPTSPPQDARQLKSRMQKLEEEKNPRKRGITCEVGACSM